MYTKFDVAEVYRPSKVMSMLLLRQTLSEATIIVRIVTSVSGSVN